MRFVRRAEPRRRRGGTTVCALLAVGLISAVAGTAAAAPSKNATKSAPTKAAPTKAAPTKAALRKVRPKPAPVTSPPPPQCTPSAPQTTLGVTAASSNYLSQLKPSTAWPIARGGGVVVALLDTGVARSVGLAGGALAGRLEDGGNFAGDTDPRLGGLLDCDGQGTGDAGLIAATDSTPGILPGIAPDTTVLSVRVQADSSRPLKTPAVVTGIGSAIAHKAGVIVVSSPCPPSPGLAAAIERATRAGIVVMAAVGDQQSTTTKVRTSFPASYPRVFGVASAPTPGGSSSGLTGPFVNLVAPGSQLATLPPIGNGYTMGEGSARAAALAGGTAALVRSAFPRLSLAAVTTRLDYSADHLGVATPDPNLGWGQVNPYAALTLPINRTAPPTPAAQRHLPPVVLPPASNPHHRYVGAALAAGLGVVALAATGAFAAIRRGRRRGWQVAQPAHR